MVGFFLFHGKPSNKLMSLNQVEDNQGKPYPSYAFTLTQKGEIDLLSTSNITNCHYCSLVDYHPKNLFTCNQQNEKSPYLSSCKYATIPTVIITHPIEKHKTCFIQSTTTISVTNYPSRRLPAKSCTTKPNEFKTSLSFS